MQAFLLSDRSMLYEFPVLTRSLFKTVYLQIVNIPICFLYYIISSVHPKIFIRLNPTMKSALISKGKWIYLSVCLSLGLEGLFVCIRLQWLGKREEVRVGDLSVCVH